MPHRIAEGVAHLLEKSPAERALFMLASMNVRFLQYLIWLLYFSFFPHPLVNVDVLHIMTLVMVLAIALPGWVQYARAVRGSTMVERHKEYVQAARVIGVSKWRIMGRHVLPNVMGPVLVLATIQVATAIITEATLSFLGVGAPPTSPSLGTLIRIGNDYLFSGEWWITIFPGLVLVMISLSINLLGDWLRDATNPRLQ